MAHERRAVIDVGTNSVKLLVADVAGREVHPVLEAGQQTRLGQGSYETQQLQPAAIARNEVRESTQQILRVDTAQLA